MSRISREQNTLEKMIGIYCCDHHRRTPSPGGRGKGEGERLCVECEILLSYAHQRLNRCPYAEDKPPCSKCETHCYKPEMRDRMREVMRYAGPRMLKKHPILAVRHLVDEKIRGKK